MAQAPGSRSLETRMSLAEQKMENHERECALRYRSLEDAIGDLTSSVREWRGEIMGVLGKTEDEGLRKKVSSLNLDRAKWLGIAAAVGVGGGVLLTVVGWLAAPLLSSLF